MWFGRNGRILNTTLKKASSSKTRDTYILEVYVILLSFLDLTNMESVSVKFMSIFAQGQLKCSRNVQAFHVASQKVRVLTWLLKNLEETRIEHHHSRHSIAHFMIYQETHSQIVLSHVYLDSSDSRREVHFAFPSYFLARQFRK